MKNKHKAIAAAGIAAAAAGVIGHRVAGGWPARGGGRTPPEGF